MISLRRFTVVIAKDVSLTSCVLINEAPFIIDITSETIEGINRSAGSRLNNFPINDLRDKEIHIGNFEILSFRKL